MSHKNAIALLTAGIVISALGLTAAVGTDGVADDATTGATASIDMFLKIEGVEGEATRKGHEGWIEIESFGWGLSSARRAGAGASRRAGAPTFEDVSVTKYMDKATPVLAQACAEGKHVAEAEIVLYRAGSSQPAGSIRLWDVTIGSTMAGGEATADRPMEELSLNFGKIEWTYTEVDATGRPKGTVTAGWDVTANKKM